MTIARLMDDRDRATTVKDDMMRELRRMPPAHPLQGHARAIALGVLGCHESWAGDLAASRRYLLEAFAIAIHTRDMPIVSQIGVAIAEYVRATGSPLLAARMLGAAAGLRGAADESDLEISRLTAALRDTLGDRFDPAYDEGRGLSRDQAIALLDPADVGSDG
jgi:hypothetical protein